MIDSFHTKNNLSWKKRKKFKLFLEIKYRMLNKEDTLFRLALNYDIIQIICIYIRDAGCMGNKIASYVKKEWRFFLDTTITSFQVNGTLVTHYNHIEVVNLIKGK